MTTRVLIVEDNAVARSFLVRVVRESFSDELQFVETGTLEAARQALGIQPDESAIPGPEPFGLILCGLEMSDGSGLELLAQLVTYPAAKIATTLYSDDDHLFPALQCGADGYLFKEDRFEALVEELQKTVRGHPSLSPAIARRMLAFFRDLHSQSGSPRAADSRPSEFGTLSRPMSINAPHIGDTPAQLSPREHEVLAYLSRGYTVKEVARLMNIRWLAVNEHIRCVYTKLAIHSDTEAAIATGQQAMT